MTSHGNMKGKKEEVKTIVAERKSVWVCWKCPKCTSLVLSELTLSDLDTECPLCGYEVLVGEEEEE